MFHKSQRRRDNSGYLSEQRIAALGTAVGGAINILRISGAGSLDAVVETLLAGSSFDKKSLKPRELKRVRLEAKDGEWLDDALLVCFAGSASYTGEDLVELHLHGSAYIAWRIMELLNEQGIRQALPGEFSFRAVRNGKMSLTQAQAVADLIGASNDGAVRLALEKLSGTQNRLIQEIGEGLKQLAVFGELGIDFSDQDLDDDNLRLPTLITQLQPLIKTLERLRDSFDRGTLIQDGLRVAFVGLPNAGKSSFFNALLGQDRSIVSEIAGTTRDVVGEKITLKGEKHSVTLRLEDTAGLRSSEDRIEQMGIERSEKAAREAHLVLFLVDASTGLSSDEAIKQWGRLATSPSKTIGIFTKVDLAKPDTVSRLQKVLSETQISEWIPTSSVAGTGLSAATEAILRFAGRLLARENQEVVLTRLDQLAAVKGSLEHLQRAIEASALELFAADIRQALHSLQPLIGQTLPDDILGQIFSDFCIGK